MMPPDLPFWEKLFVRLAVEAACVVGIALLLDRLIRPAFWRRALWQGTVVGLLLLTASELSGFGRGLASFVFGHARPEREFVAWTSPVERGPLPHQSPLPSIAPAPIIVSLPAVKPEILRPVWWPGLLWLAGGLVILGRVAAAQILFISLRRRRPHLAHSDLNARVAAILQRLTVSRKIRLLQSPGLTSPIAFGLLRPSVVLPVDFAVNFSPAEQDAMLAHELAHLASRDPLSYLLADVSSAALWWHPQSWWARRRLHRASELAADEAAAIFPDGPAALAGCLVTLGRQMTQLPAANLMGVEGGGFRSNLAERVQRLLRLADTARPPSYGWPAHAARLGALITISSAAIALSGCLQSRDAVKPPTLQASLSQSWDTSPASTVWHSVLPPIKSEPPPVPKPAMFQAANREAAWLPMELFHVEPISFAQALQHLFPRAAVGQANPLLNRFFASVGINLTDYGSFTLFNPRTGEILARATRQNLDSVEQAIELLSKVPPVESLERVKELLIKIPPAQPVFVNQQPDRAALETRLFHIDPDTFFQGLQEVFPQFLARPADPAGAAGGLSNLAATNNASRYNSWLSQSFASLGINLTTNGAAVLFNERVAEILARVAPQDLDTMERVMEFLNKPPPRVQIDVKFASFPKEANKAAGFNFLLGNTTNAIGVIRAPSGVAPAPAGPPAFSNPSGIFPGISPLGSIPGGPITPAAPGQPPSTGLRNTMDAQATVTTNARIILGIMNDEQFRTFINAIEQNDRADILSMPRATTASGRQVHLAVQDIVADDAAPASSSHTNTPVPSGPTMDVLPTISADGFSIQMVLSPTYTEFLGYDNPVQSHQPVPHYSVWHADTTVNVWDGETVVLSLAAPANATNQPQNVLIFITPTLIDPAGNRLHTDDEMPFAKKSIPPQPPQTGLPK